MDRLDLGTLLHLACECVDLRAVFAQPGPVYPLRQHPDVDVQDGELLLKGIGPRTQRSLEDLILPLNIVSGRTLDGMSAVWVVGVAIPEEFP